jgi:HPt (histidine-containing phosphotransfer) domain-containing protein
MDDYISKPVSRDALAAVLAKWLPKEDGADGRSGDGGSADDPGDVGPPVFDRDTLLERLMHDDSLVRTVADLFLEDATRLIEALRAPAAGQDLQAVQRLAQDLHGAAASVSGERLRRAASALEQAAAGGDRQAVARHRDALPDIFEQLRLAMNDALPQTAPAG